MALGTITVGTVAGKSAMEAIEFIPLSFAGDGTYSAGGTADFEGTVQTKLGRAVTILTVIPNGACGGYVPIYDRANDKLMCYYGNNDGSDGPLIENTTSNQSGITWKLVVVCF